MARVSYFQKIANALDARQTLAPPRAGMRRAEPSRVGDAFEAPAPRRPAPPRQTEPAAARTKSPSTPASPAPESARILQPELTPPRATSKVEDVTARVSTDESQQVQTHPEQGSPAEPPARATHAAEAEATYEPAVAYTTFEAPSAGTRRAGVHPAPREDSARVFDEARRSENVAPETTSVKGRPADVSSRAASPAASTTRPGANAEQVETPVARPTSVERGSPARHPETTFVVRRDAREGVRDASDAAPTRERAAPQERRRREPAPVEPAPKLSPPRPARAGARDAKAETKVNIGAIEVRVTPAQTPPPQPQAPPSADGGRSLSRGFINSIGLRQG